MFSVPSLITSICVPDHLHSSEILHYHVVRVSVCERELSEISGDDFILGGGVGLVTLTCDFEIVRPSSTYYAIV